MGIGGERLELTEGKPWDVKSLRNRHLALMEYMIAHPEWDQTTLGAAVGLSNTRVSIIQNSPLFQLAFNEFRRQHSEKLSDLIAEATVDAIKWSKDLMLGTMKDSNGTEREVIDVDLRQRSARDILNQGHAKAVEKRVAMVAEVPAEQIENLVRVFKEVKGDS